MFQVDWSRQAEKEGSNDMDRFKVSEWDHQQGGPPGGEPQAQVGHEDGQGY